MAISEKTAKIGDKIKFTDYWYKAGYNEDHKGGERFPVGQVFTITDIVPERDETYPVIFVEEYDGMINGLFFDLVE